MCDNCGCEDTKTEATPEEKDQSVSPETPETPTPPTPTVEPKPAPAEGAEVPENL